MIGFNPNKAPSKESRNSREELEHEYSEQMGGGVFYLRLENPKWMKEGGTAGSKIAEIISNFKRKSPELRITAVTTNILLTESIFELIVVTEKREN